MTADRLRDIFKRACHFGISSSLVFLKFQTRQSTGGHYGKFIYHQSSLANILLGITLTEACHEGGAHGLFSSRSLWRTLSYRVSHMKK